MADNQPQHHNQRIGNRSGAMGTSNISSAYQAHVAKFDSGLANRSDLFIQSESPLVQEIHLHQKLKEHIKNSNGRKYGPSELYLATKNNNSHHNIKNHHHERSLLASSCSGPSEVQSTTLNIGGGRNSTFNTLSGDNNNFIKKPTSSITSDHKSTTQQHIEVAREQQGDSSTNNSTFAHQQQPVQNNKNLGASCQVCLVKEVREDLMNINKMIQERNEQISKLKAKCLRSYFERQMMD